MQEKGRHKYVCQVLAGNLTCDIGKKKFVFKQPHPQEFYVAEQKYEEIFQRYRLLGVLCDKEIVDILIEFGLWSEDQQKKLDNLPQELDDLKLALYTQYVHFKPIEESKEKIEQIHKTFTKLINQKNLLSIHSAESLATMVRNQYIACVGYGVDYDTSDHHIVTRVLGTFIDSNLSDNILRELARTEPWRTIWYAVDNIFELFGCPFIQLNNNQRTIVSWSKFFDNINESADRPSDEVIGDDDLLDGWLIYQKKKREEEDKEKHGETYARYGDNAEVFIPVNSPEEIKRVNALTPPAQRTIKKHKLEMAQKLKSVNEEELPMTKKQIQMQARQELRERLRQK